MSSYFYSSLFATTIGVILWLAVADNIRGVDVGVIGMIIAAAGVIGMIVSVIAGPKRTLVRPVAAAPVVEPPPVVVDRRPRI